MATFHKAERRRVPLKIGITGPSGSGKTYSALLLASGMGKRIAVIDTENGSASLYADMEDGDLAGLAFDTLELDAPYTIQKYNDAMSTAVQAGYDVLIIDGISQAWAGEGGLLDKKAALDARPNSNSYTNWNRVTPEQERFKARILQAPIHVICTMRSKQDYILENKDGKQTPKKVGMAPVQRDGMEYEFTLVLDLGIDHNAEVSKDRTHLFDGQVFRPSRKHGEVIMAWLSKAKPADAAPVHVPGGNPPIPAHIPAPVQPAAADPAPVTAPGPAEQTAPVSSPQPAAEGPITAEQMVRMKAALQALYDQGIRPVTIWAGISKEVQDKAGVTIVDTGQLTEPTAELALDYLGRWAAHLRKAAGTPAARRAEARA